MSFTKSPRLLPPTWLKRTRLGGLVYVRSQPRTQLPALPPSPIQSTSIRDLNEFSRLVSWAEDGAEVSIRARKTRTRCGPRKGQLGGFACATRAPCRGERGARLSLAKDEARIDRGRVDPDQLPLHSDVSGSVPAPVTVRGRERKGTTTMHLPSDLRISWALEPVWRGMVLIGGGFESAELIQ